jgi:hypothetical protein
MSMQFLLQITQPGSSMLNLCTKRPPPHETRVIVMLGRRENQLPLEKVNAKISYPNTFFLFIFDFYNIHTFIQSQYIHPSPFAEASLHILIACVLSGENFPVVPSRESNSGPALQQAQILSQCKNQLPLD